MSEKSGWVGTAAVAGLALICCAGPFLVIGLASLGVGAWLSAHGLWLLGGLALLLAGGVLVVAYRRRAASAACAIAGRGAASSYLSQIPSAPGEAGDR